MASYSGFSHWTWWFSMVFCMFTREYPIYIYIYIYTYMVPHISPILDPSLLTSPPLRADVHLVLSPGRGRRERRRYPAEECQADRGARLWRWEPPQIWVIHYAWEPPTFWDIGSIGVRSIYIYNYIYMWCICFICFFFNGMYSGVYGSFLKWWYIIYVCIYIYIPLNPPFLWRLFQFLLAIRFGLPHLWKLPHGKTVGIMMNSEKIRVYNGKILIVYKEKTLVSWYAIVGK